MLIENILSPRECEKIVAEFDNTVQPKDEGYIYNNSFGVYNLPSTLRYKLRFEKIIQNTYPNIEFSNTYTRKYLNNSYLKPHIDRNTLDVSVSVCIENTANLTWPLYISNVEWAGPWLMKSDYSEWTDNNTAYSYNAGGGVIYRGKKFMHWRENFPGTDNQRMVYIYYHWKIL
jgi:hypothetical protein